MMIVNNANADHVRRQLATIWPDSSGELTSQARHTQSSELFGRSRCPKRLPTGCYTVARTIGSLLDERANILT